MVSNCGCKSVPYYVTRHVVIVVVYSAFDIRLWLIQFLQCGQHEDHCSTAGRSCRHTQEDNQDVSNFNNDHIERRNSIFFTISSLHSQLSPTCTLRRSGGNRVQIMCNTAALITCNISRVSDQNGVSPLLCHAWDTPFWSGTLDI